MSKNYRKLEEKIIDIFRECERFNINGVNYNLIEVGKPSVTEREGECKTDVYVSGVSDDQVKQELKISVKMKDKNVFQWNKMTKIDAESCFGIEWSEIIQEVTLSLKDKFESQILINIPGKHPTKPNSILLGWKLEIANKPRFLSAPFPLDDQEVKDLVFKGIKQSDNKKNATVNGNVICDSGVADYILEVAIDEISSVEDIISKLELIDKKKFPEMHMIFTANNYRTDKIQSPCDGPRALAVYIDWKYIDGKLTPDFIYNAPLLRVGQCDVHCDLKQQLKKLGCILPGVLKLEKSQIKSEVKVLLDKN